MFKKLLVAVDEATTSKSLVAKAIALAEATEAQIMLLHVLDPEGGGVAIAPVYPGLAYPPLMAEQSVWEAYQAEYQAYEKRGLAMLHRFADMARAEGLQTEFSQMPGSPGREICQRARGWQADLIIVGSHGRTGLSELFLGSVSNYVMHHAPCSVMVIHRQTLNPSTDAVETLAAVER